MLNQKIKKMKATIRKNKFAIIVLGLFFTVITLKILVFPGKDAAPSTDRGAEVVVAIEGEFVDTIYYENFSKLSPNHLEIIVPKDSMIMWDLSIEPQKIKIDKKNIKKLLEDICLADSLKIAIYPSCFKHIPQIYNIYISTYINTEDSGLKGGRTYRLDAIIKNKKLDIWLMFITKNGREEQEFINSNEVEIVFEPLISEPLINLIEKLDN